MGLQLRLALESYIAFRATGIVWALKVRAREMDLERLVMVIEHLTMILTA